MFRFNMFCCATLAMLATSLPAHAAYPSLDAIKYTGGESRQKVTNQISVQPLHLVIGQLSVDIEHKLARNLSFVVTPTGDIPSLGYHPKFLGLERSPGGALGANLAVRVWAKGEALNGLFIEPFVGYRHLFAKDFEGSDVSAFGARYQGGNSVTAGGRLGGQWLVAQNLVLTASTGGALLHTWEQGAKGPGGSPKSDTKFRPDLVLSAGFAF